MCDDGNVKNGDGCSDTCQTEIGFTCETTEVNTGNTLTLPVVYRDFIGEGLEEVTNENGDTIASYYAPDGHKDFEHFPYSVAAGEYAIDVFHASGLVQTALSADGRPVFAASSPEAQDQTSGKANFDQWFSDTPGVNVTLLSQIDLRRNGAQNPYVFDDATFFPLDDLDGTLVAQGKEEERNVDWNGKGCWKPLLQRHQCEGATACEVGGNDLEQYQGCPMADNYPACVDKHNFSFTSEIRYWFEYKGGEKLVFRGDDDVFVYINRRLVVDLGGLHEPLGADVCGQVWGEAVRDPDNWDTDGDGDGYLHEVLLVDGEAQEDMPPSACGGLSADTRDVDGQALGLQEGHVYEVALFQAERHTCQSNYQLTLSGFTQSSSTCMATCGDGMQASTEACDEGTANGSGYGHCTVNCTPGPRCGDGIMDAGFEACDNGVNGDGYYDMEGKCAPGCVIPPYCGDSNTDAYFSEQCDYGPANDNATYGGCTKACKLGPRCGDGIQQPDIDPATGMPFEECDDMNTQNNDGCSITCKNEPKFRVK
jgi:cysteine-rich repeat protein